MNWVSGGEVAIADIVGWVDFIKPNLFVVHSTSAIAYSPSGMKTAKRGVTLALLLRSR
jgi:hypothetical protein